MDLEEDGPFRYRKSIRCIAITDICIAFFMLAFVGLRLFTSPYTLYDYTPRGLGSNNYNSSNSIPNLFFIICICIFTVYSVQLIMGQCLLSSTYNENTDIVLSRCQKWYWSSQFLNVMLGIELFVLVFSVRGGTPVALAISVIKIIFRAIANHMVKVFMWDLRTRPITYPPHLHLGPSEEMPASRVRFPRRTPFGLTGEFNTRGSVGPPPGIGTGIPTYEPPPTYEEAIREKNFPQDFNNVV